LNPISMTICKCVISGSRHYLLYPDLRPGERSHIMAKTNITPATLTTLTPVTEERRNLMALVAADDVLLEDIQQARQFADRANWARLARAGQVLTPAGARERALTLEGQGETDYRIKVVKAVNKIFWLNSHVASLVEEGAFEAQTLMGERLEQFLVETVRWADQKAVAQARQTRKVSEGGKMVTKYNREAIKNIKEEDVQKMESVINDFLNLASADSYIKHLLAV